MEYSPGVFSTLYATDLGQELWSFLNEPETIVRMTTGSALDRPAVEAIEEALIARFGKRIAAERVKQMCGHMVRQIMESQGYTVAVQNTKITNGAPFSRGTKYRRKDEVMMYSFRNSKDSRLFALTSSKTGSGLPLDGDGKWSFWQPVKGALRIGLLTGRKASTVQDEIGEKGYVLYRSERITRPA